MANKIAGSVYWIEKGRQTSRVVGAEEAFRDPDQARAQVKYALSSGDSRQIELARLAYRQYQGKRFRVEEEQEKTARTTRKTKPSGRSAKTRTKKSLRSSRKLLSESQKRRMVP